MRAPGPLFAISDRRSLPAEESLPAWAAGLGRAGVSGAQIREKELTDRALFELVAEVVATEPRPRRLLVNGRIDVALAAGADGVHLPADEVSIVALRKRFGEEPVVGRSTHSLAEVERARDDGADYVTFGPVWDTPSKARYGEPLGPGALEEAAAVGIPVLALGGVFPDRFPEIAERGAAGVAGIRMFLDPTRLPALVEAAERAFGAGS